MKDKIIEIIQEFFHNTVNDEQAEELATRIDSLYEAKSKEEGLQKHSDNIELLVAYTNWLLGEGYVDSDVYAEEPTAVDSFLAAFRKEEG